MLLASHLLLVGAWLNRALAEDSRDASDSTYFHAQLPSEYSQVNAVILKHNFAVIPGNWNSGHITASIYDVKTTEQSFVHGLNKARDADFLVWDESFLSLMGPSAKVEKIQTFPESEQRVHEAPVYLPESNELLFSDTDITGWLWLVNVDTHETRKLETNPPLHNVNGGTYHNGHVYLVTNGGSVRGLYRLNTTTGEAETILNNYRGRRFNSPNDLILDSKGNILFTDPTYGWYKWPGVQAPELPTAIYHFDPSTGAVTAMSNTVVTMPNGLALSRDEKILYVADSASTPTSGGNLSTLRNVWAFDIKGTIMSNPRVVYVADSGWPDGIRITENGYMIIAMAGGADVINPTTGLYLGRINTPGDTIFNVEPARGKETGVWLLTGLNHVYKVTMSERGAVDDDSMAARALRPNVVDSVVAALKGTVREEL